MLEGKFGVVFGVANKRSIAWSIAEAWHQAGARLALTYQGERLQRNVTQLAARFGNEAPLYPCDVTRDDEIQNVFQFFNALDISLKIFEATRQNYAIKHHTICFFMNL